MSTAIGIILIGVGALIVGAVGGAFEAGAVQRLWRAVRHRKT